MAKEFLTQINTQKIQVGDLADTGIRMVTADADGLLGYDDIPISGVTAITDLSATAWRMFYSNATTTAIQELAFGTAGKVLTSQGNAIPTWETPTTGSGTVTSSNTPANGEIAVFTSATDIEGTDGFRFNDTTGEFTIDGTVYSNNSLILLNAEVDYESAIEFAESDTVYGRIGHWNGTSAIQMEYGSAFTTTPAIYIGSNNHVCIGGQTDSATYELYVNGDTYSTNYYGSIKTAAQTSITSLGTLTSLTIAGNLTFSGARTIAPATIATAGSSVSLVGGDTTGTSSGGSVYITGGDSTNVTSGGGGSVYITGGTGPSAVGAVKIDGGGSGTGGTIDIGTISGSTVNIGLPTTITASASTHALTLDRVASYASIKAASGDILMMDSSGTTYTSINHYVSDDVRLAYGGGNVGIGNTGTVDDNLHIYRELSTVRVKLECTGNNDVSYYGVTGTGQKFSFGWDDSVARVKLVYGTLGGTLGILIDSSGDLTAAGDWTAGDFILSSDPELKNVRGSVTDGLDMVMKMNPVYFGWKDKRNDFEHIGFLTTEMEAIRPELIKKGDEYDGLSYSKISAINTAAIQGLYYKVETLEQKQAKEIKELQKQVKELQDAST